MTALQVEPRSRAQLLRAPLAMGVAGVAVVGALHLRDPHSLGSWGYCPFLYLTGLPCPGCGGLRSVNDLTNGDVAGAVSSNLMAVLLLGSAVVVWAVWTFRRARGHAVAPLTMGLRGGLVLLAVFLAFGVFRWTPWGAWLAP